MQCGMMMTVLMFTEYKNFVTEEFKRDNSPTKLTKEFGENFVAPLLDMDPKDVTNGHVGIIALGITNHILHDLHLHFMKHEGEKRPFDALLPDYPPAFTVRRNAMDDTAAPGPSIAELMQIGLPPRPDGVPPHD